MSFRLSRQCRVVKPPLRCADVTLGAAIHSGVTSTRTCRVRRRAFRGPEPGMSATMVRVFYVDSHHPALRGWRRWRGSGLRAP